MARTCDYCRAACADDALKCATCGAPLDLSAGGEAPDYRFCPFCQKRLLSLGSPACNYCGRALPESFVRARGEMLRRVTSASGGSAADREELERDSDDALKDALRSLFSLDELNRRDLSRGGDGE